MAWLQFENSCIKLQTLTCNSCVKQAAVTLVIQFDCVPLCVCVCRRDFSEVQGLYKQSTEHAAEQSHLIKQLEGLNLDTQRVLRNQEEAHTADATSYQGVFTLLWLSVEPLITSEYDLMQIQFVLKYPDHKFYELSGWLCWNMSPFSVLIILFLL